MIGPLSNPAGAQMSFSLSELQAQLFRLVSLASLGCEITITRRGEPVARLVSVIPQQHEKQMESQS